MSTKRQTGNENYQLPVRELCPYAKCYCEENVWQLCSLIQKNCSHQISNYFVVFISNDNKSIPLWRQKAAAVPTNGAASEGLVIWDYHVILLFRTNSTSLVYDLDTSINFPCDFHTYFTEVIRNVRLKEEYQRLFRVIPAERFLQSFSSDRTHMKKEDGSWMVEPPSWPCIFDSFIGNNIEQFWSMDPEIYSDWTAVLTEKEFSTKFST